MNLPRVEYYPDDPNQMPPARRRRARRLLAPLDADERADLTDRLARRATPNFDFFLFSLLAGFCISLGIMLDASALIVLGAVLAPFLAPVVGLSLGTVTGTTRFFGRSLMSLVLGCLFALAAGAVVGFFSMFVSPLRLNQAYLHAQVSWLDLLVLTIGAMMTTEAMKHPERNPAVPGVMLAYGLYVPLTVAGFGLGNGAPHLWPDAFVVYALHLACAVLAGAVVLFISGFRPLTIFGYTFSGAVALLSVVLLIVVSSTSAVMGVFGTPVAVATLTPTRTPTQTLTPSPSPTVTLTPTPVPPTPTLTRTLPPPPTITPTRTITPSPVPIYVQIDSPNGAHLRDEPGGTVVGSYIDGTLMLVLPDIQEVNGKIWVHLRGPDGVEGWMLKSLVLASTPPPNW